MKVLLALSASGGQCSVGLVPLDRSAPSDIASLTRQTGLDQSAHLLDAIETILSANQRTRSDIAALAFEAGPGSFTSLRIACSVAQGLAFGLGVPVVPIGTLEALAVQAVGQGGVGEQGVLVAIDARMSEIYSALILVRCDGQSRFGSPQGDAEVRVGPPAQVLGEHIMGWELDRSLVVVGDAFDRVPLALDALRGWHGSYRRASAEDALLRADVLAWMGRERFLRGEAVDPSDAAPVYVRDKVALDRGEQAQARAARVGRQRGSDHV
jgi:tRNA threonylcarbamoyladenosine biosynthesis protein TsaB